MAHLYKRLGPQSLYVDRRSGLSAQAWRDGLRQSRCVYVGNLSFYTAENQIHELFSKCGHIELLVMGLNSKKKNPCGFCFVLYTSHAAANRAVEFLNGLQFDERQIRVDWDTGDSITADHRRYGRGVHGLQWRDEFRQHYDEGRGGEGGGMVYQPMFGGGYEGIRGKRRRDDHWNRYANPDRSEQYFKRQNVKTDTVPTEEDKALLKAEER